MTEKPLTIYDVAQAAGVSIKTISRVLNNEPGVSPATRQKILDVVQRLDYRPSRAARSLASQRSYFIALIFDEGATEIVPDVQRGITAAAGARHYHLIAEAVDHRAANLETSVQAMLASSRPDGVLLIPPVSENAAVLDCLRAAGIPYMRLSSRQLPGEHRTLTFDERAAAADMTRHLIDLGHRRIAFIRESHSVQGWSLRYSGYCDALEAAGIAVDPKLVESAESSFTSGMHSAMLLLGVGARPSAILAFSDEVALGVLSVANRLGIEVPDQLSVSGFGDSPLSRIVWPALTTVCLPFEEMAGHATDLLLTDPALAELQPPFSHRLELRGTTARIADPAKSAMDTSSVVADRG